MCDYSLIWFKSRLAKVGEALVLHCFSSGSKGFKSPEDVPSPPPRTVWGKIRNLFWPPSPWSPTAVCIPPGAKLTVDGIPAHLQEKYKIPASGIVTMVQVNWASDHVYRDAFQFENGAEISLQKLPEALCATVLDMGEKPEEYVPHPEFMGALRGERL